MIYEQLVDSLNIFLSHPQYAKLYDQIKTLGQLLDTRSYCN